MSDQPQAKKPDALDKLIKALGLDAKFAHRYENLHARQAEQTKPKEKK